MSSKRSEVEVPEGSMLANIDVEFLYTSITHECGISAVALVLDEKYSTMGSKNVFILDLLSPTTIFRDVLPST